MEKKLTRPSWISDAMLKYLDNIQQSAKYNMFDAAVVLKVQVAFGLSRDIAKQVVHYWMGSYEERHPE